MMQTGKRNFHYILDIFFSGGFASNSSAVFHKRSSTLLHIMESMSVNGCLSLI